MSAFNWSTLNDFMFTKRMAAHFPVTNYIHYVPEGPVTRTPHKPTYDERM